MPWYSTEWFSIKFPSGDYLGDDDRKVIFPDAARKFSREDALKILKDRFPEAKIVPFELP